MPFPPAPAAIVSPNVKEHISLSDWLSESLDGAVPSKTIKARFVFYVSEMYKATELPLAPKITPYDHRGYRLPDVQGYYQSHSYLLHLCYQRAASELPPSFKNLLKCTKSDRIATG